jgi:hypothetical protein
VLADAVKPYAPTDSKLPSKKPSMLLGDILFGRSSRRWSTHTWRMSVPSNKQMIKDLEETVAETLGDEFAHWCVVDSNAVLHLFDRVDHSASFALAVKTAVMRGQIFGLLLAEQGFKLDADVKKTVLEDLPDMAAAVEAVMLKYFTAEN